MTKVYVEGVLKRVDPNSGLATVEFPAATDPSHLLDGVTIVTLDHLVARPGVDMKLLSRYAAEGEYFEHEH